MILGIDTGGTFTDVVLSEGKKMVTFKTPSTPPNFEVGVLKGMQGVCDVWRQQYGTRDALPFDFVHSTTVATNALLERAGAPTALITTRGFKDVMEIGRQNRPELYNLHVVKPEPLIPASLRFEVTERISAEGQVLVPLEDAELDGIIRACQAGGVESVAVCLLFSFLDARHEQRIGRRLRQAGFHVSLSTEVLPEFREYERTVTTAVNAYVAPVMARYLGQLQVKSRKLGARGMRIVQSNGGSLDVRTARERPVETVLSGPASGIAGVLAVCPASLGKHPRLITFDMGGTSTDVCLIDGVPEISTSLRIAGLPIGVPMMAMETIGAGGGSVVWVDAGGALQVGPQSAGARPGPACYGYGGPFTVTDANLLLDRIDPSCYLGGRMALDRQASEAALQNICQDAGLSSAQVLKGTLRLASIAMENAIRVISTRQGVDPKGYTLVSFGGAGGLHAAELAESLGMHQVLIPCHPGVLSALGCVAAPAMRDFSQTLMRPFDEEGWPEFERVLNRLKKQAGKALPGEYTRLMPTADLRYAGQSFEINVPWHSTLKMTAQRFHQLHEKHYGHADRSQPLELVNLRVRAVAERVRIRMPRRSSVWAGIPTPGPVLARDAMIPDVDVPGPCLIPEDFSTTLVPDGWIAHADRLGHLWLERRLSPPES